LLLSYDWPGNVRELRNVVETLCLLRDGRQVRARDLPDGAQRRVSEPQHIEPASAATTLRLDLSDGLESMIVQIVETALDLDGGNKLKAAARLRISARTVQRYVASGRVLMSANKP
jgi:DNA-binding NtrC family response regulator